MHTKPHYQNQKKQFENVHIKLCTQIQLIRGINSQIRNLHHQVELISISKNTSNGHSEVFWMKNCRSDV